MDNQTESTYDCRRISRKVCNATKESRVISDELMASIGYDRVQYGKHEFTAYAEAGSNVVARLVTPRDVAFRMWMQTINILGNPGGAYPNICGWDFEVKFEGSLNKYSLVEMERLEAADEATRWKMRDFGEQVFWTGLTIFPGETSLAEKYGLPEAFVQAAGIAQRTAFHAPQGNFGIGVGGQSPMIRPSTGELVLTDPIQRSYDCNEPHHSPRTINVRKVERYNTDIHFSSRRDRHASTRTRV